jgi:hypothetical protein
MAIPGSLLRYARNDERILIRLTRQMLRYLTVAW